MRISDWSSDVCSSDLLDGAGDGDVAADVANADADRIVAGDSHLTVVLERSGERPVGDDAARIVAFDGDLARIGDRSGEGAVGHDAEAVAALGERPVEIAVIVVVLGGVILVEDDLADRKSTRLNSIY